MAEDKIIGRIRKLLAMTEANGCTQEEAELAWSRAQKLMAQHAIDEEEALAHGDGRAAREAIINHRVPLSYRDEIRRQKLALFSILAKANNCRIVDATRDFGEVWVVGHESEAQFVELLAATVMIQYATERTRAWKQYHGSASRFRWVVSFAWGYMERLAERIEGAKAEAAAGKELVLADRAALVTEWMAENLRTKQKRATPIRVLNDAARAGEEAANRADLSGGRGHVAGRAANELN
jgi:hypothetical protein